MKVFKNIMKLFLVLFITFVVAVCIQLYSNWDKIQAGVEEKRAERKEVIQLISKMEIKQVDNELMSYAILASTVIKNCTMKNQDIEIYCRNKIWRRNGLHEENYNLLLKRKYDIVNRKNK